MYQIASDDLYPRDIDHRYRVYARLDTLDVLCTAATAGGVGEALVQLHDDQKEVGRRLADLGSIGVLDVVARDWILLPWQRPVVPVTFGPVQVPTVIREAPARHGASRLPSS